MFFKSRSKIHEDISPSQDYMSNRKIVGAVEPYIADMQQDVQGVLARHNDLVRKVEALECIIQQLANDDSDREDIVKMINEVILLFKHLRKKK